MNFFQCCISTECAKRDFDQKKNIRHCNKCVHTIKNCTCKNSCSQCMNVSVNCHKCVLIKKCSCTNSCNKCNFVAKCSCINGCGKCHAIMKCDCQNGCSKCNKKIECGCKNGCSKCIYKNTDNNHINHFSTLNTVNRKL